MSIANYSGLRCLGLLGALWLAGCDTSGPQPGTEPLGTLEKASDTAGFASVVAPRTFSFPVDHGAHRDYRHEWWYVTGNLDGPNERRFGFQITFFRFGLNPHPGQRSSRWGASEVYMAHFALTDVAQQKFHDFERRARGALDLAGANLNPLKVWLEDWSLEAESGNDFPWILTVREGNLALNLVMRSLKPMVLQGNAGLSQKSAERGNASYYYSGTRLETEGTVEIDGQRVPVRGLAWLDREWSSSALAPYQAGWDWFSLQLDDGNDLMFYQLRLKDGGSDPHSAGSWVAADGSKISLARGDLQLQVKSEWRAPDGAIYPARWRMRISRLGKDLLIQPVVADQELRGGSFRYWEGAVDVYDAARPDKPVGRGYLEMTGYAAAIAGGGGR